MTRLALAFCASSIALLLLGSIPLLRAADKPAAAPAPAAVESGVTVGEMRIQTIPALTYLCAPAETSFDKMAEPVVATFDKIFAAASEAKLLIARPTMLVYQDNPHFHPDKPFKMEIGIVVGDDTKLPDGVGAELKLRRTEPFKCATILYTGPVDQQGQAYQKLIPALTAAGLTPTGEEREMCLYWEGLESKHNVFFMQVGIK
jgi:effector-binding domain-containing protein